MARRANPAGGPGATEELDEQAPMMGGAPGVAPEAGPAWTPGMPVASVVHKVDPDAAPPLVLKNYRVVNGGSVMYAGCKTVMRAGKLVNANTHDLELLKRQGIVLAEVE